MSIERRLSRHFDAAAAGLPEPGSNVDTVIRRGRRRQAVIAGASALGVVAIAAVLTLGVLQRDPTQVEFDPAVPPAPASEVAPTEARTTLPTQAPTTPPSDEPTEVPTEVETARPEEVVVDPERLGAPVLVYESGRDGRLVSVSGDQREVLWPDPVVAAFPDGEGGVVLQPRRQKAGQSAGAGTVIWLPSPTADPVPLVVVDDPLHLRGMLADGRVVYSTRTDPREAEEAVEAFYAVNRVGSNPEIELLGEVGAYESGFLGPVPIGPDRLLSGSCHLMCSLWDGFLDSNNDDEPVYDNQRSIDGLTATQDGSVIGFFEAHVVEDLFAPQLVLLDGDNFKELARIDLPIDGPGRTGIPVVSLADGGNTVLVAAGDSPDHAVPGTTHLIRGALSDKPRIERVNFDGVVRWHDPS